MDTIQGPDGVCLYAGGRVAFEHLLRHIDHATHSVEARVYIWRDDTTGQAVAQALLAAADRGVTVRIFKDADGAAHEFHEAGGQSFLHKQATLGEHVRATVLYGFYANRLKIARQHPSALADRLRAHPNVHLESGHRFDHAKTFIIDDRALLLGGMCLGNDAHFELLDYMVELDDTEAVARFRARAEGRVALDPSRRVDFLVNHLDHPEDLRAQRLTLLAEARESISVEMAFFGDPAFTDALVDAVDRGVQVTIVAARRAGKLRWYNPKVFNEIRRRTKASAGLRVALYPTGVHAKLMVVDRHVVDVGSANFTTLSHAGYAEANMLIRDAAFANQVADLVERHVLDARVARRRIRHSRMRARLEHHFMERAGRRALADC